MHRIFVYGSLRRGEDNHEIWFGRGATPVADGYIRGAELVTLGEYCCIVPVDDLSRDVIAPRTGPRLQRMLTSTPDPKVLPIVLELNPATGPSERVVVRDEISE